MERSTSSSDNAPENAHRSSSQPAKRDRIRREDWVTAARQVLIKDGISGISLRRLAASLGATTGAFYWQYKRLEDLLEDVRDDWVHRNTYQITKALEEAAPDGWRMYLAYTRVLILEDGIDARYDNAIREWAHSSKPTASVLRRIEEFRIQQLRGVFEALGFDDKASLIRAKVMYFHQTGYHAMQIIETLDERLENVPYYAEVLAGRLDMLSCSDVSEVRRFLTQPVDTDA
ncbi:MAG: TetR/AcrR family transcriptional regulator [Roseovarius sp.]